MAKYFHFLFLTVFLTALVSCNLEDPNEDQAPSNVFELSESDQIIQDAFENKTSSLQVKGSGEVIKLLADDIQGDKHQRFIVELDSGQTLLIAHNIDIAPRVDVIATGNQIQFYGIYEWNDEGGVVHWTHRDPKGSHEDGWLVYQNIKYS